jgi:hypothetical protein
MPVYADPSYIAFHNPLTRSIYALGLELVVLAGAALTLRHALTRYRKGDRYHLFQWIVITSYGILMELLAFNYYQNYDHATFTVQLYHGKLPLYVTGVYVVLHYTGLKTIERLRLAFLPEALLAGFAICLLDVPFDTIGVEARWWIWSFTDRNVEARWLGVPVTSYYWYMVFGAVLVGLCRALKGRIERRPLAVYVALGPLMGVAIIVLGILAFLPFHALKAAGVPDGVVVAGHMALCVVLALSVRAERVDPPAIEPRIVAGAFLGFHVVTMLGLWSSGALTEAPARLAAVLGAVGGSIVLGWVLPLRKGAPALVAER